MAAGNFAKTRIAASIGAESSKGEQDKKKRKREDTQNDLGKAIQLYLLQKMERTVKEEDDSMQKLAMMKEIENQKKEIEMKKIEMEMNRIEMERERMRLDFELKLKELEMKYKFEEDFKKGVQGNKGNE